MEVNDDKMKVKESKGETGQE